MKGKNKREQQRAMWAKKYGTTGNKNTNPIVMLNQYEESEDFVKKHLKGDIQSNLSSGHWREMHRKEAVKMANRIKKVTGEYPDGFEEIKKLPKDYKTGAGQTPVKQERKKPFKEKYPLEKDAGKTEYKIGEDVGKFVDKKWDNVKGANGMFYPPRIKLIASKLSPEQRTKFLNMSQAKQSHVIAKFIERGTIT